MKKFYPIIIFFLSLGTGSHAAPAGFISTDGLKLIRHKRNYTFMGTNFWYGMHLAVLDKPRLIRELNHFKKLGIKNLRILAASEGPDDQPWRVVPSLQPAPGEYNEKLLKGLDFLLAEMRKRDLTAVIMLGNYWQWSGGLGQYLNWVGAGDIPYPEFDPLARGGNDQSLTSLWLWARYNNYLSAFYVNEKARELYYNHIRKIVSRRNSITGRHYKKDSTIMAWQLANEPAAFMNSDAFDSWVATSARLIKSIDPDHLVSTGSMGEVFALSGVEHVKNNAHKDIDYATIHIWVQNSGLYDPQKAEATYAPAVRTLHELLFKHRAAAKLLNKPLVFEEFGMSRDFNTFKPNTPVSTRDDFYKQAFDHVIDSQKSDTPIAGVNFWAWGGEGVPIQVQWEPGHPLIGDPPHEAQGWYSVYTSDKTTLDLIQKAAIRIKNATSYKKSNK